MRNDGRETLTTNVDKLNINQKQGNNKFISHLDTVKLKNITEEQKESLNYNTHIWTIGDKFYKLSLQYYGTLEDWYIIAHHNNKPTEFHVKQGDKIKIPFPLSLAKSLYGF